MAGYPQILIEHFRESQRQIQTCIVWSIGASLSWLLLALSSGKPGEGTSPVPIPGSFVGAERDVALIIAFTVYWAVGAMATYAAQNAIRIVAELGKEPDAEGLLAALGTYPSVGNERYPGVRVIAAVLPFLLFLAGAIVLWVKTPAQGEWWPGLIAFGLIPPGTLLMLIRNRITQYKPNQPAVTPENEKLRTGRK